VTGRAVTGRAVAAWVLYDLANTMFSVGVVSAYFSLYVRSEVGAARADGRYGLIVSASMAIIFALSPLLGAMTDRARRRMPFLVWSTLLSCGLAALLGRFPFALSAVLFVIANVAYQAGTQFYDALLPEVSTEENRGRVGGLGVGIGYVGSFIAIGLGELLGTSDLPRLFTIVAGAFLIFALPCFLFVRERGNPNPRPPFGLAMIRESTAETLRTLRSSRHHPGLVRFLVGRVFYTDAINTVTTFLLLYTVNVAVASGLAEEAGHALGLRLTMWAIGAAIAGGLAWGWVVDRLGPKRTLTIVLGLWVVNFLFAVTVAAFALAVVWMFALAIMGGIALGGTWAADRPFMLRLTPPDRIGEFYGLYGMAGRFSAVFGPLLWSSTTYFVVERGGLPILAGQSIAILVLLLMLVVAWWLLRGVSDEPRDWGALSA
jgi:UMF1 family MFS transporter